MSDLSNPKQSELLRHQGVEHLFFLDYTSYPITLGPRATYKVIETRVKEVEYDIFSFEHLVVEVRP